MTFALTKTIKMLVVEDNALYAGLLDRYLSDLVDELNITSSWSDAERYIADSDIAWIDLVLPPDDAESSIIRIGEVRQKNAQIVIFVVSGMPDDGKATLADKARQAGADHFVYKFALGTHDQIIAVMIHALMTLSDRGCDVAKYLNKARQLLSERVVKAS